METDKHYFFEGLFIIGFGVAAAFFALWLGRSGSRTDVVYRTHFTESVSGLALGDPVKYQGVDVGTVKTMLIDPADPRRVEVDLSLHKDTPVKTDTKAKLELKGITGVVFVELSGGSPGAPDLKETTAQGEIPEIPTQPSSLEALLDRLPKLVDKFSSVGDQAKAVLGDVHQVTTKLKENPSLLLSSPKENTGGSEKQEKTGFFEKLHRLRKLQQVGKAAQ